MDNANIPQYPGNAQAYIIATYILAPTLFIVSLILVVYVCCSRKYKLNWFEKNLLESSETSTDHLDTETRIGRKSYRGNNGDFVCVSSEGGTGGLDSEGNETGGNNSPVASLKGTHEENGNGRRPSENKKYLINIFNVAPVFSEKRQSSGVDGEDFARLDGHHGDNAFQREFQVGRDAPDTEVVEEHGIVLHHYTNERLGEARKEIVSGRPPSVSPDARTSHKDAGKDNIPRQQQRLQQHHLHISTPAPPWDVGPPAEESRSFGHHHHHRHHNHHHNLYTKSVLWGDNNDNGSFHRPVNRPTSSSFSACFDSSSSCSFSPTSISSSSSGRALAVSPQTRDGLNERTTLLDSAPPPLPPWRQSLQVLTQRFIPQRRYFRTLSPVDAHSSVPPAPPPSHPPPPPIYDVLSCSTTTHTPPSASSEKQATSPRRNVYPRLVAYSNPTCTLTSMGSLSSTPGHPGRSDAVKGVSNHHPSSRNVSGTPRGSLTPEQFWVPSAVLQKKRAQSLIPSLLHRQDSDESSSPSRTPTTSTSLQEMTFSYPPEKLTETVSPVQTGGAAQGRGRRRASMQDALDATMINTSLYDHIPVPQPSQDFGSIQEEHLGSIHFSLDYNPEQGLLTVRLIQARDLVPRDFTGTADPYCRICLLPQRRPQLQSKVQKKTTSPEFAEDFIFEVPPGDVDNRTLEILVYDYDQYSRDEPIGEVLLPLEEVDLSELVAMWKGISPASKQVEVEENLGDLMVSMGYLASAERLTVSVLKARYLRPPDDGKNTANPLVKVQIVLGNKRLKKKKTSTKKNTLNPTWNEAVVFNLSKDLLSRVTLEFYVCSDNLLGSNETLGKMSLGPEATGEELSHWKEFMNAKSCNAMYHRLAQPPQESPTYHNMRRCSDFS